MTLCKYGRKTQFGLKAINRRRNYKTQQRTSLVVVMQKVQLAFPFGREDSIPDWGVKIPHVTWQKQKQNKNIIQKQYCNKIQ